MPLSPADLSTLSRLLDEAMDLPAIEVEGWLAALPAEQASLVPRLRQVLGQRASSTGFMDEGPRLEARDDSVAKEGDAVGTYRLIRAIGRGGMGDVWLAERSDGTLKRKVALKLPRLAWGAGLAERMARERDIGALLEHPNIARLYDAGVDAKGRPFLALEYIDGMALDGYCQAKALSIRERLRLFLQVVRAVAYAHGRLVVHRDLKPSNVLVTPDGQAHLLDFGIAKLLDDASPGSNLTQEQGRVLTPHYASPEQIKGETITVASDVYSLGVLLYELLTVKRPNEMRGRNVEQVCLEEEPPHASSRIDDKGIRQQLRGELDSILAKALRPEPGHRYTTADAFADDVERHLKGERVVAQPDSLRYRLGKTLRRHRTAFVAGSAIAAAVLGGASVSLVQAKRAGDAAERARVVKEFVIEVFRVNERGTKGNNELRQLPAQMLLEHGARLIETKFPGQPRLQAELYGVVGGIFADMGASDLAATYATREIETLVVLEADSIEQARATLLLAQALLAEGRLKDAVFRARRALTLAEKDSATRIDASILLAQILVAQSELDEGQRLLETVGSELKARPSGSAARARAMALQAFIWTKANRFDAAERLYRTSIEEAISAEGPLSSIAIDTRLVLAHYLVVHDRSVESRDLFAAAMASLRASGPMGEIRASLDEAANSFDLYVRTDAIPFEDARLVIDRSRAALEAAGPSVPPSLKADVDFKLAAAYVTWGDLVRAHPLFASSAPVLLARAEAPAQRSDLELFQGTSDMMAGHHEAASQHFSAYLSAREHTTGLNHPWASYDYAWSALNLRMRGRLDEAQSLLLAAPAFSPIQGSSAGIDYSGVIPRALAALALERGDAAKALSLLPVEDSSEPDFLMVDDGPQLRGEILCALGRPAEGLARIERSLATQEVTHYPSHPALARNRAVAGLCALDAGQRGKALELAKSAHRAFDVQPDVSAYFKTPLKRLEAKLGEQHGPLSRNDAGSRPSTPNAEVASLKAPATPSSPATAPPAPRGTARR